MAVVDVIKYEGTNDMLVAKYPGEDFNTLSQLIVHESQEAVFFKNGQALDLFGPGRYKLETQNIPLLSKLVNLPFGGVSPFHCEIYFINKTEEMGIRWGTSRRSDYMDPKFQMRLSIGAAGELTMAVADSRKLLVKLVGTEAALSRDRFIAYMRSIIDSHVRPYLSQVMQEGKFTIFDVDAHMQEFADYLGKKLKPDFADYGIDLRRFMVTNIAKPVDDPNYVKLDQLYARQQTMLWEERQNQQRDLIRAETRKGEKILDAQANAEKRRVEGYTYQQERQFDVSERVASNSAVGEFTNLGIGMGMIGGIGGTLSGNVAQMANGALSGAMPAQAGVPGAGFPGAAGAGVPGSVADGFPASAPDAASAGAAADPSAQESPAKANDEDAQLEALRLKVRKLKVMHDEGLLDDEEFKSQKARLISEL